MIANDTVYKKMLVNSEVKQVEPNNSCQREIGGNCVGNCRKTDNNKGIEW